MKASTPGKLRVFASKPFMRFARRFGIGDEALWETVNGAFDADLGGGLFKFRLAREGEGSSGGARALIAMRVGQRAVLMFGFEKKDQANISPAARSGRAFMTATQAAAAGGVTTLGRHAAELRARNHRCAGARREAQSIAGQGLGRLGRVGRRGARQRRSASADARTRALRDSNAS